MSNNKYIHTFNYRKLQNGKRFYNRIRVKVWLWGIGITYESSKKLMGFALNSRKYPTPKDLQADSYTQKYPRKIHKK